jgi:sulfite exporter TauE/SafE
MIGQFSEGFILGLATGTTCLATCGPIYAPYLMQVKRTWLSNLLVIVELSAGRFISYLLIGALAGAFGSAIAEEQRIPLTIIAYILFSSFLIVSSLRSHRKERCCSVGRWYAFAERPLILGVVTGINLCPPFFIAFTKAMDNAGVFAGMLFFTAFFAGTTLFLLPLVLAGVAGQRVHLRMVARIASVGVGIWFIVQAGIMLYDEFDVQRVAANDTRPIVNLMDSTTATALVEDTGRVPPGLRVFLRERKGATILTPYTTTPPQGYIFIEHALAEKKGAEINLRLPGRFICILPPLDGDSAAAVQKARSVAQFIDEYNFRFDRDSGTVYRAPENAEQ